MTIKSKVPNDKYREEWDRIFGKFKERHPDKPEDEKLDKPETYKEDQKH